MKAVENARTYTGNAEIIKFYPSELILVFSNAFAIARNYFIFIGMNVKFDIISTLQFYNVGKRECLIPEIKCNRASYTCERPR